MIFGDWSQIVIGMWSGLDILVDQTTLGTSGGIRIIAFLDMDCCVRHAESFSALTVTWINPAMVLAAGRRGGTSGPLPCLLF